jgi:hypothetical protein
MALLNDGPTGPGRRFSGRASRCDGGDEAPRAAAINLSDAERVRYDADESWFNAVHASCRSHRHSVSGSLTKHCGKCFPMPPMSPSQLERIRAAMTPTPLLRHTVERTAHRSHSTAQSALSGSVRCIEIWL